jgi:putative transposase
VIARGNDRQRIIEDDNDRAHFFELLAQSVERYDVRCHAACLMDNHYHLLLQTPRANLSLAMRQINGRYAQAFNRKHNRCGHVFQARFRSILVEGDEHFLEACRYIVLNPVRARMCEHPADYRWSTYRASAGLEPRPDYLTRSELRDRLGVSLSEVTASYRAFVNEGADQERTVVGERFGSRPFLEQRHEPSDPVEHPFIQIEPLPPALELIFTTAPLPVLTAYRQHGYTLKAIAAHLDCHYATVSRRLRREETTAT